MNIEIDTEIVSQAVEPLREQGQEKQKRTRGGRRRGGHYVSKSVVDKQTWTPSVAMFAASQNAKLTPLWSEFASMLAKVEKQRQKSQTELSSLKRQQEEMLRMSPGTRPLFASWCCFDGVFVLRQMRSRSGCPRTSGNVPSVWGCLKSMQGLLLELWCCARVLTCPCYQAHFECANQADIRTVAARVW